jgi:hypothetical protein
VLGPVLKYIQPTITTTRAATTAIIVFALLSMIDPSFCLTSVIKIPKNDENAAIAIKACNALMQTSQIK